MDEEIDLSKWIAAVSESILELHDRRLRAAQHQAELDELRRLEDEQQVDQDGLALESIEGQELEAQVFAKPSPELQSRADHLRELVEQGDPTYSDSDYDAWNPWVGRYQEHGRFAKG